jgi:hypothetical protein
MFDKGSTAARPAAFGRGESSHWTYTEVRLTRRPTAYDQAGDVAHRDRAGLRPMRFRRARRRPFENAAGRPPARPWHAAPSRSERAGRPSRPAVSFWNSPVSVGAAVPSADCDRTPPDPGFATTAGPPARRSAATPGSLTGRAQGYGDFERDARLPLCPQGLGGAARRGFALTANAPQAIATYPLRQTVITTNQSLDPVIQL